MAVDEYRDVARSCSSPVVPSSGFVSARLLTSPDQAVEGLYHEALHNKLSNFIHAGGILRDGCQGTDLPRFSPDWRRGAGWDSNRWAFDRALYAFHVYAHLALLYGAILESSSGSARSRDWALARRAMMQGTRVS